MAKDGGDFVASWALHVHEVGVGALHQALLLVLPLLLLRGGVQEQTHTKQFGEVLAQSLLHSPLLCIP